MAVRPKGSVGIAWELGVSDGPKKKKPLQVLVLQRLLKLPGLDLNQDKESQNLLCYRYTTG